MPDTILITGSNRGIGLELCKQYVQLGWEVHACCRQPEHSIEISNLASEYSNIEIHSLDVTNALQITNLAKSLESASIDILINNAGIYGQGDSSFGRTDEEKWLECFRVNTIAPLKVMESFVNHVGSSHHKIIASMSSKMGSMDDNGSGGCYDYRSSKAALNAVMASAAIDLKPRNIKVAILHPGWVKTDMGGPNAEITTEECVINLREILNNLTLETSGTFFEIDGSTIPW
jgi:NAD(P)-dependent dehydrogenase (short-subunit alcohol dehydrogenase family)